MPLTDKACLNAKPRERAYKLADGGGMYLLIEANGAKYWRMKYRFGEPVKKEKVLAFGIYPRVTLAEARSEREKAQKLLSKGLDPRVEELRERRERAEAATNTFELVAREWHSVQLNTWGERTAKNTLHRLETDIFPEIGQLAVSEIKHQDLILALRKVEKRGALEVAHRLRATCARILNFAMHSGRISSNPAAELKHVLQAAPAGEFAAIGADDLPQFIKILDGNLSRMFLPTSIALRLMMLIFIRTSELIETPWSEVNLSKGEWIIPWQRMKRGKRKVNPDKTDHHVCLSTQAIMLLRELHRLTGGGEFLFPNQRDPSKPMSNNTLLKALERMGYKGQMTGHGFRSLAMSTLKERLGYRHETVDRQLAHAQRDKLEEAYDRANYLAERRKMMQEWANYIDGISLSNVNSKPQHLVEATA